VNFRYPIGQVSLFLGFWFVGFVWFLENYCGFGLDLLFLIWFGGMVLSVLLGLCTVLC